MRINIYSFVCLISMTLCGGTFMGYCMEQLLPVKETAPSPGRRLFFWTLFPLLSMSVKVALMNVQNATGVIGIANIFCTVSAVVMVWKFYDGKILSKYCVYAALLCMTLAGDITFGMLYLLVTGQALEVPSYSIASSAMACTGTALIGSLYMVLIVWFGSRKKLRGRLYVPVLMVLLAVFVCAGAAGAAASGDTQAITYDAVYIFVCACISFTFYLCLCILFVLEQRRSTKREREAFLRTLELEQTRYRTLEDRQVELTKLRHDYKNVLATVTILLENGETEKAGELLAELSMRANAAGQAEEP